MDTNEKIKIIHIVESFGGGVFSFLVDLINTTSDKLDITVVYAKREQTPENFQKYFNSNIKFIEMQNLVRNINLVKDLKAFFEIRKIVKQICPNIVHLHSSKAGVLGRFAINGSKTKVFYTPHGYSFLKQDDSKLKRFIYKTIEKTATIRKSTIVACSKGEYEESLKLTKNATYVNNGIDIKKMLPFLDNVCNNINSNNLTICTIGRICYQKNPMLFNKIAEKLPKIKFIWIGDGELKKELTNSNIEITGWKTRDEVMNIINNSTVFILPSLWEGLPISLLEAMYLKKVCIVSNVIGNKDVIQNERNGFIADGLDEFVSTIECVFSGKYDLDKIANNAYDDVLKEYNIDKMSEEYMGIYEGK